MTTSGRRKSQPIVCIMSAWGTDDQFIFIYVPVYDETFCEDGS